MLRRTPLHRGGFLTRRVRLSTRRSSKAYRHYGQAENWPAMKRHILARDGGYCLFCGASGPLDVHHGRSVGAGGRSVPSNLLSVCRRCHSDIHAGAISRDRVQAMLDYVCAGMALDRVRGAKRGLPDYDGREGAA